MLHRYGRQWFAPTNPKDAIARDISLNQIRAIAKSSSVRELASILTNQPRVATKVKAIGKRWFNAQAHGATDMALAISFVDWYEGFREQSNFITDLLDQTGITWCTKKASESDIIFSGCYGAQLSKDLSLSAFIVFVSGENLRPDYTIHDFSITTDAYSYDERNARLPEWHHLLDYDRSWQAAGIKNQEQYKQAIRPWEERRYLVSAVYNNATPVREEVVSFLRKTLGADNVHIFGSQRGQIVDKNRVLGNSKINICFENSLYPGYITEKIPQCLLMGCHALYWGHGSWSNDFKARSLFNYADNRTLGELERWVKEMLMTDSGPCVPRTVEELCNMGSPIAQTCSMLRLLNNAVRRAKELLST